MTTHLLDQLRGDASRIDHGFIGCYIEMQIALVDALERPEVCAKRRAGPFTGVAVHFTVAIPIAPEWTGAAGSWQKRSRSAACSNHCRPDSGRLENALAHGTGAARGARSAGSSAHLGGDGARANAYKYSHQVTRHSESLSCGDHITFSTVATHEPKSLTSRSCGPLCLQCCRES